ncbi:MAG: hypothetical protein C4570_07605 [Ammonifex sp.]|nr:MAG: hypothetical protein C4570_07605 [Ammonifex sp.]
MKKKKFTIKEAVEYFAANRKNIPVLVMRKGDYALEIKAEDYLYLVVEVNNPGVFLARLGPDLMRLKPLDEQQQSTARAFAHQRLTESGLL